VERDVSKTHVNILFNDEIEDPTDHKTDRPVSKAVKRAQQRQLVKEELIEFAMPHHMQYTAPKSTETGIMKVMKRDCQKSSTVFMSPTPTATDSMTVTLTPTSPRAAYTSTAASKVVASPATITSTTAIKPTATATPVVTEDVTTPVRGRSEVEGPDRGSKAPIDSPDKTEPKDSPTCDEARLEFNSAAFKTVKKGGDDNPELDDVTTVKVTMVTKSDVNERTVTEPDLRKPAPSTMVQRVAQSPHEVNTEGHGKLKDELVDENNNEDKDVGER
jgi:hypothetical protein